MIKKIAIILTTTFLIVGCANRDDDQLQNDSQKIVAQVIDNVERYQPNTFKPNIYFYVPRNIGILESSAFSSLFIADDEQIILNISPNEIILNHDANIDSNVETESDLKNIRNIRNKVIDISGEYEYNNQKIPYYVFAYPIHGNRYYLQVKVGYAKMSVNTTRNALTNFVNDMFVIGASMKIEERSIVTDFHNQEVEVTGASTSLNTEYFPSEGFIPNLIDGVEERETGHYDLISKILLIPKNSIKQKVIEEVTENQEENNGETGE